MSRTIIRLIAWVLVLVPLGAFGQTTRNPYNQPGANASAWNVPFGDGATWSASGDVRTLAICQGANPCQGNINTTANFGVTEYLGSASNSTYTFSGPNGRTIAPDNGGTLSATLHVPSGAITGGPWDGTGDNPMVLQDPVSFPNRQYTFNGINRAGGGVPSPGLQPGQGPFTAVEGGEWDDITSGLFGQDYDTGLSGFNLGAGLINACDVTSSCNPFFPKIKHGLRYILPPTAFASNAVPGQSGCANVLNPSGWPDRLEDCQTGFQVYTGNLPFGSTLGIPLTDTMPTGLDANCQGMYWTMQHYPLYPRDIGGGPLNLSVDQVAATSAYITSIRSCLGTLVGHLRVLTNQHQGGQSFTTNPTNGPGNRVDTGPLPLAGGSTGPSRAGDFLNMLTIQGGLSGGGSPYLAAAQQVADIKYLGITHYRDGLNINMSGASLTALQALINGGISMISQVPYGTVSPATQVSQNQAWQALGTGALYAIEGLNEPELATITYNGQTGGGGGTWLPIAKYMTDYITAIKATPSLASLPIYGVSRPGAETNNVGLQYIQVPSPLPSGVLSPANSVVAGAITNHIYPTDQQFLQGGVLGACQPNDPTAGNAFNIQTHWDNVQTFNAGFAGYASDAVAQSLPRVATEFGYPTSNPGPSPNGDRVNEDKKGRCILNGLLTAWQLGEGVVSIYNLYDLSGDGFGLFQSSGVPAVSGGYFHNLTTILSDQGSTARTFTTVPVAVSYSGLPIAGQTQTFQKSNGHYQFVLWSNQTNWNMSTGTPITVAPTTVTVNLPSNGQVSVYDTTVGTTPISTNSSTTSVSVAVADAPIIVDFIAGAASPGLIPGGYVHMVGNQTVSSTGVNVKIASLGYVPAVGTTGSTAGDLAAIKAAGFNTIRWPWYDVQVCPGGSCNFSVPDAIVAAASAQGIKVIMDHHGNEYGNCTGQQTNGLPYDLNSNTPIGGITWNTTNNTNGCGQAGTVSFAQLQSNWLAFANHYNNNSTVIGFDMHNEPLSDGATVSIEGNWGGNNGSDLLAFYNIVGTAMHTANPNALIICEGLIGFSSTMLNGQPAVLSPGYQDLSLAQAKPVSVGSGSSSVVLYSVHDYPNSISDAGIPSSTAQAVQNYMKYWGYLIPAGLPVWIGELGASLDGVGPDSSCTGCLAQQQTWAANIVSLVNGQQGSNGGFTFSSGQQPLGTDWFAFGNNSGGAPDGICSNTACTTYRSGQFTYWQQLLFTPSGSGKVPVPAPLPGTVTAGSWLSFDQAFAGITLGSGKPFHFNVLLPANYNPTQYTYPIEIWEHPDFEGDPWYLGTNTNPAYIPAGSNEPVNFNTVAYRTAYPAIVVVPYADQTAGGADGNDAVRNWGGWVNSGVTGGPTVYSGDTGPNVFAVLAMINYLEANYSVDTTRVYCNGFSLGGIGCEYMLLKYNSVNGNPAVFTSALSQAGVLEINGAGAGPTGTQTSLMQNVPVWWFSGANDSQSIPSHWNSPTCSALGGTAPFNGGIVSPSANQCGTSAMRYTLCPSCGHQDTDASGNPVWVNTTMTTWMFSQVSGGTPPPPCPTCCPPNCPTPPTGNTTWNSAAAGPNITLSNGQETATTTGASNVLSTTSHSTGTACFTITANSTSVNFAQGFVTSGQSLTAYLADTGQPGTANYTNLASPQAIYVSGVLQNFQVGNNPSSAGDVNMWVIDFNTGLAWTTNAAMRAAGYPWNDLANANPVGEVGGIAFGSTAPGPWFIAAGAQETGSSFLLNTVPTGCPTGFNTWDSLTASSGPLIINFN